MFPTAAMAEEEGYASFNKVPTLAVDVPDGTFTISATTSEGKRITFSFLPYKDGGAPQCVDVCYHDGGKELNCNSELHPTFDVIGFGSKPRKEGEKGFGHHHDFDTRKMTKDAGESRKIGILCVLMADKE
jgi:hypothetical protein